MTKKQISDAERHRGHAPFTSSSWIIGNFTCFSNHLATVRSCFSWNERPMNWSPTGKPLSERAVGTLMAGNPERKEVMHTKIYY